MIRCEEDPNAITNAIQQWKNHYQNTNNKPNQTNCITQFFRLEENDDNEQQEEPKDTALEFLFFAALRKEFLLDRSSTYPFAPNDTLLDSKFNYTAYLHRNLVHSLEHIVHVHTSTYIAIGGLAAIGYGVGWILNFNIHIMGWLWITVQWLVCVFNRAMKQHLFHVRCSLTTSLPFMSTTNANTTTTKEEEGDTKQLKLLSTTQQADIVSSETELPAWCDFPLEDDLHNYNNIDTTTTAAAANHHYHHHHPFGVELVKGVYRFIGHMEAS